MRYTSFLALMAGSVAGCNRYELFRLSGYQQASFSNKADVLFVIDNSESMLEESESLATNFAGFISSIDALEQDLSYGGLADAVTNFVDFAQDRGAFVDYQFAITTTDARNDAGELTGPLVLRGEDDVAFRFTEGLICDSTCFPSTFAAPSDPDYQCGQPLGSNLSSQFLDCACGSSWQGNCGDAEEMGLESVFLAMCRAVPNPPVECFEDVIVDEGEEGEEVHPARLTRADIGTNAGMLRDNANFIPIVVSDEGDGSPRTDRDDLPEAYQRLFEKFGRRMSWVFIGPGLDAENKQLCPGTGTDWGVTRYNYMVHVSDGLSIDIFDDGCTPKDFEEALDEVAQLLTNLVTSFPLQSVPVAGTIQVLVDGDVVGEAEVTGQDSFGLDEYSDGWTYRGSDNAVVFHGADIPSYDARIEVYYLPVDGMPRELPF